MAAFNPTPPPLLLPGEIALVLFDLAARSVRLAAQSGAKTLRRHRRAGNTVRPGPDTPLWNELVRQTIPHLRKRGAKAALARALACRGSVFRII